MTESCREKGDGKGDLVDGKRNWNGKKRTTDKPGTLSATRWKLMY